MRNIKEAKEELESSKDKVMTTNLQTDQFIIEQVYKDGFASFLSYQKSDGLVSTIKEFEYQGKTFIPAFTADICGFIPLPSKATEYGTQEDLIKDLKNYIKEWVVIDDDYLTLVCYYVLFSWVYDAFYEVPYLRIIADLGSGKTRLGVHVLGQLLYKPIAVTAASSLPSIFRILDKAKGSLIVDEADLDNSDKNSEFVQVINSGYTKNGVVLRMVGVGVTMQAYPFSVFGPKVFISREHFKDHALESRCLPIVMQEARDTDIDILLKKSLYTDGQELRDKLLLWRFRQLPTAGDNMDKSYMKLEISTRFKQLFMLLSSVVSEESKDMLKKYAVKIEKESIERRKDTAEGEIIEYLYQHRHEYEITCASIAEAFNAERDQRERKSAKSIGWYLNERIGLRTTRFTSGNNRGCRGVQFTQDNKNFIEKLVKKYGITDGETTPEIPFE